MYMKKQIYLIGMLLFACLATKAQTSPWATKTVTTQTRTSNGAKQIRFLYDGSNIIAVMDSILNAGTRFTSNLTVQGTTFGKYNSGDTINAVGLTAEDVIKKAIVKSIPPTYTAPSATVSGVPAPGTYERGTVLSIVLTAGGSINDGGSFGASNYFRGTTDIGSNTDNITLTTATTYKVTRAYTQGPCKPNNLGTIDCTGRINAGTATSANITYNVADMLYYGRSAGPVPTSAEILAAAGGNKVLGGSKISSAAGYTVTASGANYYFLAYINTQGTPLKFLVGGIETSLNQTAATFNNAQGLSQSLVVYTSINPTGGNVTMVTSLP